MKTIACFALATLILWIPMLYSDDEKQSAVNVYPILPKQGFEDSEQLESFYDANEPYGHFSIEQFEINGDIYYGCTRDCGNIAQEAAIFIQEKNGRFYHLIVTLGKSHRIVEVSEGLQIMRWVDDKLKYQPLLTYYIRTAHAETEPDGEAKPDGDIDPDGSRAK